MWVCGVSSFLRRLVSHVRVKSMCDTHPVYHAERCKGSEIKEWQFGRGNERTHPSVSCYEFGYMKATSNTKLTMGRKPTEVSKRMTTPQGSSKDISFALPMRMVSEAISVDCRAVVLHAFFRNSAIWLSPSAIRNIDWSAWGQQQLCMSEFVRYQHSRDVLKSHAQDCLFHRRYTVVNPGLARIRVSTVVCGVIRWLRRGDWSIRECREL